MDDSFLFQNFLFIHVKATKEEDNLYEEDYDDYRENEQKQAMWNNIATLAEVLENKPQRKVRTPVKDREIREQLHWEEQPYQGIIHRGKISSIFPDEKCPTFVIFPAERVQNFVTLH